MCLSYFSYCPKSSLFFIYAYERFDSDKILPTVYGMKARFILRYEGCFKNVFY